MSHDAINSWVQNAKNKANSTSSSGGVRVIIHSNNQSNLIVELAERIRPYIHKIFAGARDNDGMLLQPAHIRGIALDVAHDIIKKQKPNNDRA